MSDLGINFNMSTGQGSSSTATQASLKLNPNNINNTNSSTGAKDEVNLTDEELKAERRRRLEKLIAEQKKKEEEAEKRKKLFGKIGMVLGGIAGGVIALWVVGKTIAPNVLMNKLYREHFPVSSNKTIENFDLILNRGDLNPSRTQKGDLVFIPLMHDNQIIWALHAYNHPKSNVVVRTPSVASDQKTIQYFIYVLKNNKIEEEEIPLEKTKVVGLPIAVNKYNQISWVDPGIRTGWNLFTNLTRNSLKQPPPFAQQPIGSNLANIPQGRGHYGGGIFDLMFMFWMVQDLFGMGKGLELGSASLEALGGAALV